MEASASPALALDEIQGNLAGFFKPLQRFVFLRFRDAPTARAFIGAVVPEIDSCEDVLKFRDSYRWNQKRGRPTPTSRWFNLVISAAGLEMLEAPERELFEAALREGMKARASLLGDVDGSDPANWVAPFGDEIHAMAILAADTDEDLERLQKSLRRHTDAKAHPVDVLGQLDGRARADENHGHEHFGFLDGISQPAVEGLTGTPSAGQKLIPAGEFVFGYPRQDEQPPDAPSPGYPPPPPAPEPQLPSWAKNGSMVVLRRLRQDVKAFNDFVAAQSGPSGLRPDLLEAKLVGRYKSGAPLERTLDQADEFDPQSADPAAADPSILEDSKINNFEYEPKDADGHLVPRAAHIRKTYPRNQNPPGEGEAERRRILRRGITYGPDFVETESPYPGEGGPPAEQDRGLVFVSYQASIEGQFEFIQSQWVNKDEFPQAGDGRDPIISQDTETANFAITPAHHLSLARWVTTSGGEYFVSPSASAPPVACGVDVSAAKQGRNPGAHPRGAAPVGDEPAFRVLVSTSGKESERFETIPITRQKAAEKRVVIELSSGGQSDRSLPALSPGDRLQVSAELEVTTDCELQEHANCVANAYAYAPTARANLILAAKPTTTDARSGEAVSLATGKDVECSHAEHHKLIVFTGADYRIPEKPPKWMLESPSINLVLSADHEKAAPGDVLLIGQNDPGKGPGRQRGCRHRPGTSQRRPPSGTWKRDQAAADSPSSGRQGSDRHRRQDGDLLAGIR